MEFLGYDGYEGDPDVYPPSEDSVQLIESLDVRPGSEFLEIGCGSGIVSIHAALNGARVTAVDINPRAVEIARINAEAHGARLDAFQSDLFSDVEGRFDLVVFNLPYLPVEEGEVDGMISRAWAGGTDGLGPLPELLAHCPGHLKRGGKLAIVVSSLMNGEALDGALSGYGTRVLSESHMFFETLKVLEISFPGI